MKKDIQFTILFIFFILVSYKAIDLNIDNKKLELKNAEMYTLPAAMDFYKAGYQKAYDRARGINHHFFIEEKQFTSDSLMFIRTIKSNN